MKREERKEENNNLKDWKKPELKVVAITLVTRPLRMMLPDRQNSF
jgi:hypothetical protein